MSTPHLVERAAELALIDAALERSRAGRGAFVVVEGPAGVGKSTLLAAAAAGAHQAGAHALLARGGQYERGLPFEIARQLLERPLARDPARRERALVGAARPAGRLVGAEGPAAEQATPLEARHALYWLVANLADETPLVLVVDDLQWADPSSQQWLLYLARRLTDLPFAVVASWRTGEGSEDLLDQLSDEGVTERVRPQPLSVAAVADVVHAALDRQTDPSVCAAAHRVTGGNPFLLHELLRAVDGRLRRPPRTSTARDRSRWPAASPAG
jgi:predicted ATPase